MTMKSLIVLVPLALAAGCGHPTERTYMLGALALPGYHVRAGAATGIPTNDVGFAVTANGRGGFGIGFASFQGAPQTFTATLTCDSTFDPGQISTVSGYEQVTVSADNRTIQVSGVPGDLPLGGPEGVEVVPLADPLYLTADIDGAAAHIYFTGGETGFVVISAYDPVAFTSP
jgi:hypothetical protein